MTMKTMLGAALIVALGAAAPFAWAQAPSPQYDRLGRYRAAGEDPNYHVNEFGYGNYVRGPDGSFGGYPAGSAGAVELENEHRIKCRDYPESC